MDIDFLRNIINESDDIIIGQTEKRLDAVVKIAKFKLKNGLAVYDAEREKAILAKIRDIGEYGNEIACLYEKMFEICRNYQSGLMAKRNIVLIGMPGSGKTTVGKTVSGKTGLTFFDTDEEIRKREGMPCSEIILSKGEEYFRNIEKEVVKGLVSLKNTVIATGGGSILLEENRKALMRTGSVIFLERETELLETNGRPLSANGTEKLYRERKPLYEETADFNVKCDSVEKAADEIVEIFKKISKKRILVINGPNLNLLGVREPDIYGATSYNGFLSFLSQTAKELDVNIQTYQSDIEGEIIDIIHASKGGIDGLIINPGGFTHTSVAIPDAIKAVGIPTVEVHISDISKREEFRHISLISSACVKTVSGEGIAGYKKAMEYLVEKH